MVTRPPQLVPSLLAGDHAHLADGAASVAQLGLPWIHIDIMDGHFVPNLSFGPELLAALRRSGSRLFFDTHLMLSEPGRYVEAFARAGADQITIHVEPEVDHAAAFDHIRELGFGGQSFRADVLAKIEQLALWRSIRNLEYSIEVDGGIDLETAAACRSAGADKFVAGTAFFHAADRAAFASAIEALP
jgi:ribulose-phosphate 3-epimerase